METMDLFHLTPEQLQAGLVHGTLAPPDLDRLLTTHVHENENIDALVQFFLQYIPGDRTMDEFIKRSKRARSTSRTASHCR